MINFDVERVIDHGDNTTGIVISFSKDVIPPRLRLLLDQMKFHLYIDSGSGETAGIWSSSAYREADVDLLIKEYAAIKATINRYGGSVPDFDGIKCSPL
ncbi:MAG: hypothetical protein ACLP29_09630 [Dissulfurispiraceae bacterium]